MNCSSLPFPFFSSRSCCQCCFSGKFPTGLHDGLGRVLQTAGRLLRADTRAGSGPQPGPYSCFLNPTAHSLGELGTLGTLLRVHTVKQRYLVAEEAITELLFQRQSLISLVRGFWGENWELICFSWGPFLITPRLF